MAAVLDQDAPDFALPRVLLLDGRAERRQVMRVMLETGGRTGQVVAEASTARDAVAAVDRSDVDAVVVEVQMPVADGLAAISALRAAHPLLRIVVCSFHGDPSTRRQAVAAGADSYLSKPVSARELRAALRATAPPAAGQ